MQTDLERFTEFCNSLGIQLNKNQLDGLQIITPVDIYFDQAGNHITHVPLDSNVEAVIALMRQRVRVGIQKYGVTTERDDLSLGAWLTHAQQEAMDFTIYLQTAHRIFEKIEEQVSELRKLFDSNQN